MPTTPRAHLRFRRRLKVVTDTRSIGFTVDASAGGLCVESLASPAPRTSMRGQLNLDGREFPFVGVVAWLCSGDLRAGQRSRYGLHFAHAPLGLLDALQAPESEPRRLQLPPPEPVPVPVQAHVDRAEVREPTLTREGEHWLVLAPGPTGRVQEYRCTTESQAQNLLAALLERPRAVRLS